MHERGPAEPRLAGAFTVVGLVAALNAATGGGALAWLWPAAVAARVAIGYARGEGGLFGKRSDGTLAPLRTLVLAPYHAVAWLVWRAMVAGRENAHDEIGPGLFLGRRPREGELPPGTTLIVDLTAEFARRARAERATYVCLPTLDGAAPPGAAFARLVEQVAAEPGVTLVHCAAGHGRSAVVVAAALIVKGLAADPAAAAAQLRARRPAVRMSKAQRALLASWFARRSAASSPP